MEELEPDLGMFLLVFGGLLEYFTYLDIPVFLCPGGVLEVLGVSLTLTRESGLQVLLGF